MRTALLQVKEELGSDAVIMSNKKVAGGVEIVAAIDGESNQPAVPRTNNIVLGNFKWFCCFQKLLPLVALCFQSG